MEPDSSGCRRFEPRTARSGQGPRPEKRVSGSDVQPSHNHHERSHSRGAPLSGLAIHCASRPSFAGRRGAVAALWCRGRGLQLGPRPIEARRVIKNGRSWHQRRTKSFYASTCCGAGPGLPRNKTGADGWLHVFRRAVSPLGCTGDLKVFAPLGFSLFSSWQQKKKAVLEISTSNLYITSSVTSSR